MMTKKLALDVGCGNNPVSIDGYSVQTLDARIEVKPTYVSSIDKIPVPDQTFDLVFASHILEHVKRNDIHKTLKEWRRVLKDDGILQLILPDLEIACIEVLSLTTTSSTWDILYGAQDHDFNIHYCGYTWQALEALIKLYGFSSHKIERKDRCIYMGVTKESGWIE
jgi:predicted SAM-dependent methyltransferase